MPYRYTEERGKTLVCAEGNDSKEAFVAGAQGLFEYMVDHGTVAASRRVDIAVEAKNEIDLFAVWLNDLLSKAEVNKMVFAEFDVTSILKVSDKQYLLTGVALGQIFDRAEHKIKKKITKVSSPKGGCEKKSCTYSCSIE